MRMGNKRRKGKTPCIEKKEEKGQMKQRLGWKWEDEVMYFPGYRAKFKYLRIQMYHLMYQMSSFLHRSYSHLLNLYETRLSN